MSANEIYGRYLKSVKPPSQIPTDTYRGTLHWGGIDVLEDDTANSYDHIFNIILKSELKYAMHFSILETTTQGWRSLQESLKEGKTVHCVQINYGFQVQLKKYEKTLDSGKRGVIPGGRADEVSRKQNGCERVVKEEVLQFDGTRSY
ncbi:hypothetical protein HK097_000266 [Rhizophlyctis rosea]|uniref:Uncharacterized protein n=1 Tax=Rhizophlyctis rosea TaxID=64517 RepID=A0AAD5S7L1_9FUNG|nr:hypothetical protein HK097_000266 [Rhizophlyctis rosea]